MNGGMAFGDELVTEMKEGVAGCEIVVLMISDAFCNSGNCMFEFINIVANRKHVIPHRLDHGDRATPHHDVAWMACPWRGLGGQGPARLATPRGCAAFVWIVRTSLITVADIPFLVHPPHASK